MLSREKEITEFENKARHCSVGQCSNRDVDSHHIKSRGSGGSDDVFNLLDLCRTHHTEIHQIGNYKFCKKYPEVYYKFKEKGYALVERFGVIKLERAENAVVNSAFGS